MRRHLARLLPCAPVLEVGGDAGAAEGVVWLHISVVMLAGRAHHSPSIDGVAPLAVELRFPTW
jgi:hypothetical protein